MKKYNLLLLFSFILLISGCSDDEKSITKLDDLKDVSIGAMTGSTGEQLAISNFPDASIKSFDDIMDAIAALQSNQIDAVITAFPTAMNVCKNNPGLKYLQEPVDYENTAMATQKGNKELHAALNKIITKYKNDGTLADMKQRWFKKDTLPYKTVDIKLPSKGKTLRVGTSATREPFCFVDADQQVTGHDGELARRIASELGRPVEFFDMKFSALISALKSGKVDVIIAGMTATEERQKSVDFTESYFQNSQVIIARKKIEEEAANSESSTKLRTIDDLKDKRIAVLLGSVHDTYALKTFPDAEVMQYKSPSEILLAVKSEKVDAAIYTTESLSDMFQGDPQFQIFGDKLFSVPVGMGFNKENDSLREKLNEFLKLIKDNGVYDDMYKRWITDGGSDMPRIKNSNPEGTLNVGIVSDKGLPFAIVKNNKVVGFDIEFAERFAAYVGKKIVLSDMDFGSLIISAATNKIDMIASTLMITEERQKQIDFSDPYYNLGVSLFALTKNIEEEKKRTQLKTLDDIAGKTVGVYVGTIHDDFVVKHYPNAEVKRFNAPADMILSIMSEKVDVAFFDLPSGKVLMKSNNDIGILTDEALTLPIGVGFNKNNPELRNRFNAFLKTIKSDGTYNLMYKRWFVEDPVKAVMPKFNFDDNANLITVAVGVGDLPNSAIVNGEHVGFDIELLKTFAKYEGFNIKILTMEFSSLIAALSSGKVEIIADGISITHERQKQIDFSDSYNLTKTVVLALKKNLASYNGKETPNEIELVETKSEPSAIVSFFNGVVESFESNIIKEKRYLLILSGLQTTMIISIMSTLFGTLLGGLICFMRMSHRKILTMPAKVYISLLRGTPVLVVLMLIFYVVFASVDIDPVIVAVIAFGLNFAAYVSEMFRTGIEGVDRGQTEAGIAIGFTKVKTFIYIILPQAVRRILPVYKGEVISLVKMTSIVGYIAVQDLTKASDIIRSRTFDAFFPLIMVAVLYFLISWLLMLSLGYVERLTNPKLKAKRG